MPTQRWIVYTIYGQKDFEEAFYSEKEALAYIMTCEDADETQMDTRWEECGCLVSDNCSCGRAEEDDPLFKIDEIIHEKLIKFTAIREATWEQQEEWLKSKFGADKHYEWRKCDDGAFVYKHGCAAFRCDCHPLSHYIADSDDE